MFVGTGESDSMWSTTDTCVYPLTTLINFKRISPSDFSLLFNIHFTGNGFLPSAFTLIPLMVIHALLDIKLFTS